MRHSWPERTLNMTTMEATTPFPAVPVADVVAAQRGDQTAFTRLVASTCALVSSIAIAIARDPDVGRDIAQDVFLSAWRDIGKLREPSSFLPWLRQITRHRAHHVMRTSRRRGRRIDEQDTSQLVEMVVDPRPDPGQRMIDDERRRAVVEAIDLLPSETREVVTLFYREGQSVAQVAALLDLSEAAVRQRLSRARARLRDEILDRLGRDLVASAPGHAFVAGVAAALTAEAPAAASAATIGASGAKAIGPLGKAAGLFGGAALGAAGSALSVAIGVRRLERTAYDDEERRALRRLNGVNALTTVAGALGIAAALRLTQSAAVPTLAFAAFIVGLLAIHEIWLPRILQRRHDAEMRADPLRAQKTRRRERVGKVIGWTAALLVGGAAMLFSIVA